jgi:alkanesulfonate monooxygenase SsuD/methylene tetrahydromethanopterin reductase-like flavin-dependent oxidoreductase (luciferase family)
VPASASANSSATPQAAEDAGFDFFSVGESHQEFFASQAHAVILGAIAQATKSIRIGSTSTILSTSDPVRVFENFATIDLTSPAAAPSSSPVAPPASGLFELLGYDLRDYEELFEEKFDLLQKINARSGDTWSGQFRAPLNNAEVLPRPAQDPAADLARGRRRAGQRDQGRAGRRAHGHGPPGRDHLVVQDPPSMPTVRRPVMPASILPRCRWPRPGSSTRHRPRRKRCKDSTRTSTRG